MKHTKLFILFSLMISGIYGQNDLNNLTKPRFDTLFLPEHHSNLRLTFTHEAYAKYDFYMGREANTHTAVKPYTYKEVQEVYDMDAFVKGVEKNKKTWVGRKLWNEHLFQVKEDDFWFNGDFTVGLSLGKDNSEDIEYTYNNTRIFKVQGGLGKNLSFYAAIFESQARFTSYLNKWVFDNKPPNSEGLVPGRNKAKRYATDAYDYSVSEGYVSWTPSKFFNIQTGNGTNFIGDGYRSLVLSDAATPYPFVKINTTFWKFRYTNLWMWMRDMRRDRMVNGAHARKYVSLHYLSYNITKNWNIGLLESIITAGNNGMDMDFLNPLLFYKTIEFSRGENGGNGLLAFTSKWVPKENIHLYGQFLFDEFKLEEIQDGNGWWANKYGYQLGVKYFNAFKVNNLFLQAEYNRMRPYTGSHGEIELNYGHYNQPIGHLWGSNFSEFIAIARYSKNRFFANAKVVVGEKGFDPSEDVNYGGDIFKSYNNRVNDYGNFVGQGSKAAIFIGDIQAGYLVNPVLNLRLFAGMTYRTFDAQPTTYSFDNTNTTFFQVGLRSNLFNWNTDF